MKGYFTGKPLPKDVDRYSYCSNRLRIEGPYDAFVWADRINNIADVEKIRIESIRIRKPLNKRWSKFYNIVRPHVHIHGWARGKHYYLDAAHEGISFKQLDEKYWKDKDRVKFASNEDLPLYIGQEKSLDKDAMTLVHDRLKGPEASDNRYAVEVQRNDDLIAEYLYLEGRFHTLNKVTFLCNTIIKRYIENKYYYFYQKYQSEDTLIELSLNNRTYVIMFEHRKGFKFVRFPESSFYTDDGDYGEYSMKNQEKIGHL